MGDRDPREHEFSIQLRAFDTPRSGSSVGLGVLVALSGKRPEELTEQDYLDLLKQLNWTPTVDRLQQTTNAPATGE